VWVYILFFVFWGPEMTQDERNEEAAKTLEFEEMRAQGVSLAEIGLIRSRGGDVKEILDVQETEVHEKDSVRHVEEA